MTKSDYLVGCDFSELSNWF